MTGLCLTDAVKDLVVEAINERVGALTSGPHGLMTSGPSGLRRVGPNGLHSVQRCSGSGNPASGQVDSRFTDGLPLSQHTTAATPTTQPGNTVTEHYRASSNLVDACNTFSVMKNLGFFEAIVGQPSAQSPRREG